MKTVVDLVRGCHDHQNVSKMFIAVCAPSLSGKTQMAISLDRFSEHPFIHSQNIIIDDYLPLRAVLRITVSHVRNPDNRSSNSQLINWTLFARAICSAVQYDFKRLLTKCSHLDGNSFVECANLETFFHKNPSSFLGIIVSWIKARITGTETLNLRAGSPIHIDISPLNIQQSRHELSLSGTKPIVVVLDEFDPEYGHGLSSLEMMFIRNILRVCGFVVIVMGTNSKLANDVAHGNEYDFTPVAWAQVMTNVFSCPQKIWQTEYSESLRTLTCLRP